jgi:hypothetical protein
MSLTFPTGKSINGIAPPPGRPERATHCVCDGGPAVLGAEEHCWRCGHHPRDVISETWSQRARKISLLRAKAAA